MLLGSKSDHIVALDFDDESFGLAFDAANPELIGTTRTRGARGWTIWLRMKGPYPPAERTPQCEWRAEGWLSMFQGVHPSGVEYKLLCNNPPREVAWEEINWPEGWEVPGVRRLEEELLGELVSKWGPPYYTNKAGEPSQLGERFWAAMFSSQHRFLYEPSEGAFYRYEESEGLWKQEDRTVVRRRIGELLHEQAKGMNLPWLERQTSTRPINAVCEWAANINSKDKPFDRDREAAMSAPFLHTANTMLVWRGDQFVPEPFSPDFYSRNASPIRYEPQAECPRFLNELLGRCLGAEDARVLQMAAGMFLLGYNLIQVMFILDGASGTGKSQLGVVLRGLVGEHNCVNLRTDLLHERFEIGHYYGKTLLLGSDVGPDFLSTQGAPVIKSLIGGDRIMAEFKGVAQAQPVSGHFNMLVTANSRLRLRLQDDADAWRRRVIVLTSEVAPPTRIIPDFGRVLLREEGPGILNWAIDGLKMLFGELAAGNGRLRLSTEQHRRVERTLAESDSLRVFLVEQMRWDSALDATTDEILARYVTWSVDREFTPLSDGVAQRMLARLMPELFRSVRATDIERGGKMKRGFRHVTFTRTEHT